MDHVPSRPADSGPSAEAVGRTTARATAGIAVSVVAAVIFGVIWDAVKDQDRDTTAFDRAILTWMHFHQVAGVTDVAKGLAFMGSPPVIVIIGIAAAIVGLVWPKVRGAAWTFPIAILGAGLLIQAIKLSFHRARPALFTPLLHETGYSFPSGHSMIAMTVYGLLGYFVMHLFKSRRARLAVRVITAAIILLIGISRVYVQVHFPTDVLAGWLIGFPWLVTCVGIHEGLARRFKGAGEPVLENPSAGVKAAAGMPQGG